MAPRGTSLFAVLTGAAVWCGLAAFGLAHAAAGATKPFPGFGLLLAGALGVNCPAFLQEPAENRCQFIFPRPPDVHNMN